MGILRSEFGLIGNYLQENSFSLSQENLYSTRDKTLHCIEILKSDSNGLDKTQGLGVFAAQK